MVQRQGDCYEYCESESITCIGVTQDNVTQIHTYTHAYMHAHNTHTHTHTQTHTNQKSIPANDRAGDLGIIIW